MKDEFKLSYINFSFGLFIIFYLLHNEPEPQWTLDLRALKSSIISTPLILLSSLQSPGVGEGAGFVWCCYLGRALCWEIQEPLWCRVRQDADSNWSLSPGMVKNMLPSSEACLTESMMALLLRIPRINSFWKKLFDYIQPYLKLWLFCRTEMEDHGNTTVSGAARVGRRRIGLGVRRPVYTSWLSCFSVVGF